MSGPYYVISLSYCTPLKQRKKKTNHKKKEIKKKIKASLASFCVEMYVPVGELQR